METYGELQGRWIPLANCQRKKEGTSRLGRILANNAVRHAIDQEHGDRCKEVGGTEGVNQVGEEAGIGVNYAG